MIKKSNGLIIYLLLTFLLILPLFADEVSLSTQITNHDIEAITSTLENAESEELPEYERLVLDAAKSAVVNNDLDYAYTLAEMVLLVNLDNDEAQRLFTSIKDVIRKNEEIEAKKQREAEQKRLEEE